MIIPILIYLVPLAGFGAAPTVRGTLTEHSLAASSALQAPAEGSARQETQREVTFYHGNGAKAREGLLVDGRREGHWRGWHANGKPAWAGGFSGYRRTGTWLFYDEQGERESSGDFVNGTRSGAWTSWYPD
ncbi:MAG: hypothetical protein QF411_01920, partial [Planctomycetota bacterium]|nr:hypothetical protein [Planctomycetota bacterium]